ncbi:MAG: hypothetical protein JXR03_10470 [Cyclobacteriaceae bacterium]
MKATLLIIPILLLATTYKVNAQHSFITTYVEKTNVSPKQGIETGYEFKSKFEIGLFYQTESNALDNSEKSKPRFYEKEFTGFVFAGPLFIRDRYCVKAKVRTGVSNRTNFAITPSLSASYRLFRYVELNSGVGIRAFKPTYLAGLRISL